MIEEKTEVPNLGVPELVQHLRKFHRAADPLLKLFLVRLSKQLQSWENGANRDGLREIMELTMQEIERRTIPVIQGTEFPTTN